MTPEDRERQERIDRLIEFLANNQAQLSAQQAGLSARQAQLSTDIENLRQIAATHSTQIGQLADTVLSLARVVESQGQQMDEQRRITEEQRRITEEQFRITGERLNALIAVVERYFSNGRKD